MAHLLDLISPQIHTIGSYEGRNWSGPLRVIYDQEMLLIDGGTCETQIEGEKRIISAPASYLIKPSGIPHSSVQTSKGTIRFRWVHFDWIHQEPSMDESSPRICHAPAKPRRDLIRTAPAFVPRQILHGPLAAPASLFQLFDRMQQRWSCGTPMERASCRALFLEILIEILGGSLNYFQEPSRGDYSHHLANRIREMLNRLLENPRLARLPLEQEMAKLGYSYPHLCRIFKRAHGISPLTYFNNMRMERASLLLRDTALPINEVARQVGIDNPAYFTRLFVKHSKKNPRRFRNEL
ncbi:MAG: AraC family transcriptional regulator [Verrucomicrobia bacterium Tous-C9LFEB]|nr:MAG: AraC family transcriptional regulator [Verrucomicrobia bacterium Tous-C9LFEB]